MKWVETHEGILFNFSFAKSIYLSEWEEQFDRFSIVEVELIDGSLYELTPTPFEILDENEIPTGNIYTQNEHDIFLDVLVEFFTTTDLVQPYKHEYYIEIIDGLFQKRMKNG